MTMVLPWEVTAVMERMQAAGYACHAVGGCVRDGLLGLTPQDWDLTTNALPEQVAALFADYRVILTGMAHGTVTVLIGDMPIEITTYRVDGEYHDHRRPDGVRFVTDITEDLRRRDLTVNAMAWEPTTGLCDPFGGANDLKARVLRCVGNAEERFNEDALRILRTLRFAATYGFAVEEETAAALFRCAPLLCEVAGERIASELNRLLVGKYAGQVLERFAAVLYPVLPELQATEGIWQYSPYHDKDVLGHTIASLTASPAVLPVRLALLLHDCGKPRCFEWISEGFGHFPKHPIIGAEMAEGILRRLHYDNHTTQTVCRLIRYHDDRIPNTDASVRRWLYRLGEQTLYQLLDVKEGDCNGHAANLPPARKEDIYRLRERIARVVAEGQCTAPSMLAIGGRDVLALGIPAGRAVGRALAFVFERVLDGELPNEREALLAAISSQKDLIIS